MISSPVTVMDGTTAFAVETRRLVKDYHRPWSMARHRALGGVDIVVRRGEVVGLLGPNGSGKTTLLRILLGLVRATSGSASVLGHLAGSIPARTCTGFLPEENDLYPFLSGREAVDLAACLYGVPRRPRRRQVDRVLDQVGMGAAARLRIRDYSRGMARRIAVACALVSRPEVLLLDEPGSGLDPIGHRDMLDLVRQERERGATVVLSSHLLAEVEGVCDRLIVLHRGAVVLEGAVEDLLARRERMTLTFSDLGPEAERLAVEAAVRAGARCVDRGHPRDRLEALFLRTIPRDASGPPGGRREA